LERNVYCLASSFFDSKNPIKNWTERLKSMMNIKFNWEEVVAAQLWVN
jgi:hypothetical protein